MNKFEQEWSKLSAAGKRQVAYYRQHPERLADVAVQAYLKKKYPLVWAVLQLVPKSRK